MSRCLLVLVSLAACSKSAGPQNQDTGKTSGEGERIAVPGGGAPEGAPRMGMPPSNGVQTTAGGDDAFRLKPDEGTLKIEIPADAKAGAEVTAKILVIPSEKYKVNKEFPTKLTLTPPAGVTLAKAEMKAGGADESKGDADAFEDKQLAFSVKLTPQPGNHKITGTFKFAVCDKDVCLAKKEQIELVVAAK
ncbi:MAG: hypothetical protein ACKV2T_02315 [Kofleriaceae bacterium]